MPVYSTATPDVTSPATSDWHLSEFEKKPAELPLPTALGRILVVRRFACPAIGGHLVLCGGTPRQKKYKNVKTLSVSLTLT